MTAIYGFGDYAWKSPFDTCPVTSHPISWINWQVAVSASIKALNYNYKSSVKRVNLA